MYIISQHRPTDTNQPETNYEYLNIRCSYKACLTNMINFEPTIVEKQDIHNPASNPLKMYNVCTKTKSPGPRIPDD